MPTTPPPTEPVQAPGRPLIQHPRGFGQASDPCPEMDAGWYVLATINAARLHALRVQRDQMAWIARHHRLSGARKARHTRQLIVADGLLRDLAGLLIAGRAS